MREGPDLGIIGMASRPRTESAGSAVLDERVLLERIKAQDVNAFERLYRIYQPRLARFLITLVQRPQLVEEVLDDTMMVVWQTAASFRGTSKLSTWVFAIAYRKAVKARARWPEPVAEEEWDNRVSNDPTPDQELEHQRLHDALIVAMSKLSAQHRAVV